MWAAIVGITQAIIGALFAALRARHQDNERDAAIKSDAINTAALETQEVVKDAADKRASLPASATNPDDVARQLRAERTDANQSRRRRPF